MTHLRTLSDDEIVAMVEAGRDDLTTTALEIELCQRLAKATDARHVFLDSLQDRINELQSALEFLSDEITTMKEQ